MKKFIYALGLVLLLGCACLHAKAQTVIRTGNTFTQQSKQKAEPTKTQYVYIDKDGNKYPIYLSSKGKAFIIKVSKKTGKEYRQYLPEITKQISK